MAMQNQICRMQVKADCIAGEIHNFWNNIHFHPTDAIEDSWGQHILEQVSKDGAARYVRIYAMLEDIVGRDAGGRLRYDFRETDRRLDYLTEKGFKLLICFNFLPRAIAVDPECMSWLARYKGKHINTSKPRDYQEWQEVCRAYTEHLRERYGEERLAEWYFHCWNEPDFPDYFLSDAPRGGHGVISGTPELEARNIKPGTGLEEGNIEQGTKLGKGNEKPGAELEEGNIKPRTDPEARNMELAAEEYTKLYDHFAEGVTKACRTVKIGGPSAALSNQFIEKFLRHVKEGINWANGGKGTRMDFLSIHTYGAFPKDLASGKPVRVEDTYKRVRELEALAGHCGFPKIEIVVDEWGLSTEGFTDAEKCPVLNFRNTEFYAAAYAHMIHYYVTHHAPVSLQMICLSGQHNLTKEFHGYRSFFTLHGFPKPIYNAYALCAKLGEHMLEGVTGSGELREGMARESVRSESDGWKEGIASGSGKREGMVWEDSKSEAYEHGDGIAERTGELEWRRTGSGGTGELEWQRREAVETGNSEWQEADGSQVGMLPTVDEKGRIAVLLYCFSPSAVMETETIRKRVCRHVRLEIMDLYGGYQIRHYRIDHGNANAYTAWRELGGPHDLNQAQMEWVRGEGKLKLWYPEEQVRIQGQWSLDIVMTDNAVSLVELEPHEGLL